MTKTGSPLDYWANKFCPVIDSSDEVTIRMRNTVRTIHLSFSNVIRQWIAVRLARLAAWVAP